MVANEAYRMIVDNSSINMSNIGMSSVQGEDSKLDLKDFKTIVLR